MGFTFRACCDFRVNRPLLSSSPCQRACFNVITEPISVSLRTDLPGQGGSVLYCSESLQPSRQLLAGVEEKIELVIYTGSHQLKTGNISLECSEGLIGGSTAISQSSSPGLSRLFTLNVQKPVSPFTTLTFSIILKADLEDPTTSDNFERTVV